MADNQTRSRCIEVLEYARGLAKDQLDLTDCPHHGYYAAGSGVCRECSEQYECEWLFRTDQSADLHHKPDDALISAVEFAVHYIGGFTVAANHTSSTCQCGNCTWLREAQGVLDGAQD